MQLLPGAQKQRVSKQAFSFQQVIRQALPIWRRELVLQVEKTLEVFGGLEFGPVGVLRAACELLRIGRNHCVHARNGKDVLQDFQ